MLLSSKMSVGTKFNAEEEGPALVRPNEEAEP